MAAASFLLTRATLPHMYAQTWGQMISISFIHDLRGLPIKSGYVSVKVGLEGLSKTIALEGVARGATSCINSSMCAPGWWRRKSLNGRQCTSSPNPMSSQTSYSVKTPSNGSLNPLRWGRRYGTLEGRSPRPRAPRTLSIVGGRHMPPTAAPVAQDPFR